VSKAFTKEDSATDEVLVPARAPLPDGVPNYVTPRGLEQLRAERQALEVARSALRDAADAADGAVAARLSALSARLFEVERRIASAQCVEPQPGGSAVVRFGSVVTLLDDAGREQRYQLVGVDEAEPSGGKIAFLSPLAKVLLGAQVGDSVRLEKPGGVRQFEVLAIE
jgi:transcription elongation factor GreB